MNQEFNSAEELAMDGAFRDWVKNPTPELETYWQLWIGERPGKKKLFLEARALVLNINFNVELPAVEKKQLWAKIMGDINAVEDTSMLGFRTSKTAWYAIAASVTIIMLFGAFLYFFTSGYVGHEYRTTFGEIKTVELPDGSKVTLNGNTTLKYNPNWKEKGIREVWLKGEAFFAVSKLKNADKSGRVKFVVHSPELNIEVLGTQFNVVSRREKTKVSLNEGRIRILLNRKFKDNPSKSLKEIIMAPGEMVSYSRGKEAPVVENANAALVSSWKDYKYNFNNTSLKEVVDILEDTYGVNIQVSDKRLLSQTINGTIASNNLDVILKAISITGNIKVKKESNVIYLIHNQ